MSRRLRALAALALCGVSLPLAGCGHAAAEKVAQADTRSAPIPVTVALLERRTVEKSVDVVGTLHGWDDVTIGSKREGRVARVRHDMGDHVKPGELLVELETLDADLSVQQAERRLQSELAKLGLKKLPEKGFDVGSVPTVVQARVACDKAAQNLARDRALRHKGAGTQQDLDNAENDVRSAEASCANAILTAESTLASAQAARVALDVARQARLDMEIRAPVPSVTPPGVTEPLTYAVIKRRASEGQTLKQGDPVFDLVIENPLRLWVSVPERYQAEVRAGQSARVRVASYPDTEFEGTVARINPAVDSVSRTFQVEVAVPNNRGLLRPGGFAKASILANRDAQADVAPSEAIVRFAGVTKLFVVEGDKARAIEVETGQVKGGWVEVVGKLPKGAQVVTTGQTQLADGTTVTVRVPETAAQ
ncbi:MAG: efflux RND transporter periplasmic adaptor subunit [Isosphaeraceae bacterium]|nr:efflux RND transporter periplasmic adaptor subunit [Isosphaeraceae bacterium]